MRLGSACTTAGPGSRAEQQGCGAWHARPGPRPLRCQTMLDGLNQEEAHATPPVILLSILFVQLVAPSQGQGAQHRAVAARRAAGRAPWRQQWQQLRTPETQHAAQQRAGSGQLRKCMTGQGAPPPHSRQSRAGRTSWRGRRCWGQPAAPAWMEIEQARKSGTARQQLPLGRVDRATGANDRTRRMRPGAAADCKRSTTRAAQPQRPGLACTPSSSCLTVMLGRQPCCGFRMLRHTAGAAKERGQAGVQSGAS